MSYQKKKEVAAEREKAESEKEEAEKYTMLMEELQEQTTKLQLFQLHHNENEIVSCDEDLYSKQQELTNVEKRRQKLKEVLKEKKESGVAQRELTKIEQDIREVADVGSCRGRAQQLQEQLKEVASQLGDARVDKHEEARRKKKQEIVESFKRDIPGVPTHRRYNVAITKVLGKYMEAIVVDTEKTALRCIQVLKERMLEPEIFLPLDDIQAKPLERSLREIREPKNVKLLFDVLHYQPAAIRPAVLFVTNNALVCETPEDASRVAYDLHGANNDAVALDGTFY